MSNKITRCFIIFLYGMLLVSSIGGVFATWNFAEESPEESRQQLGISMNEMIFVPEEMPDEEVVMVQRLSDILNNQYTTDKIDNALDYLINETIQVFWGGNIYADPYVGSMDVNFQMQIKELFGDILTDTSVSFILKNQDLNWDGYKEITMYSTSDPLDCVTEFDGTVCVYVTVFTPKLDEFKRVVGYTLVCESLRGYCSEVYYGLGDNTPSFSTDEWKNDIGYYHYFDECFYQVPEDAVGLDGITPIRDDYYSYNKAYQYMEGMWGTVIPYGQKLWECIADKIPYL